MGKKTNTKKKQQKSQKRKYKHVLGWPEWALLGIVAASTVLIIISLCTGFRKSPEEKAEREMKKIAEAYYTEYLYPRLLGNLDNDPKEALKAYAEAGVPSTYLRQLLHYNNDEYASSAKVFEKLECNTNSTGVKFFPVEPYGPRDYRAVNIWQCEKADFSEEDS